MVDIDVVRTTARGLPEAEEHAHHGRPAFRVGGKIFATLWPVEQRVVLKLAPADQAFLVGHAPAAIAPVAGAWGHHGWTSVELEQVSAELLQEMLTTAWRHVAPKRLTRADPDTGGDDA